MKKRFPLTEADIYSEKMKLSEVESWYAVLSNKDKILFNELLLSNMTIMNRAIWSDEETSDQSKLDSLKWSNELAHRIWNIRFDLKLDENEKTDDTLIANITFYAKQSTEFAGHVAATITSTIGRYYYLKEDSIKS